MKNSISTVISRRTLQKGKECTAYLFSPVEVESSTHWNKKLQGFTISNSHVTSMEEAEELVKDIDDIFINKLNSSKSEIVFVQGNRETLNAWYKMMKEGKIASKIWRKFDFFSLPKPKEEDVERYRKQLDEEIELHVA